MHKQSFLKFVRPPFPQVPVNFRSCKTSFWIVLALDRLRSTKIGLMVTGESPAID